MAAKRRIEADDLFEIKLVNDPDVSPDGSRVVVTVTELDGEDAAIAPRCGKLILMAASRSV